MSRALEGLSGLPWGVHLAVALAFAAGLVVWLSGEKFLKPMVVLLCGGVGATLGLLMTPATPWGQSGSLGAYHHMFIGLGVGAVLGMLIFRSAAALALGVVLAMLLPMGTAAVIGFAEAKFGDGKVGEGKRGEEQARVTAPAEHDPTPVVRRASYDAAHTTMVVGTALAMDAADEVAGGDGAPGAVERAKSAIKVDRVPENLQPGVEAVRAFWTKLGEEAREGWARWSGRDQAIMMTVGALGLVIGVVWGMGLPKWSNVAVSAMFGAAVWLPSFVWLSNAMGAPWKTALDLSPLNWLMVWGVAGVVGMVVQYSGVIPGSKSKPGGNAPKPAPAK